MIQNTPQENKFTAVWVVLMLAALLFGIFCSSCSKRVVEVVEAPRVSYVHDTINVATHDIEKVYVRDSITIKGDTVTRDRLVYRDRLKSDTLYKMVEMIDTVTVVKTVQLPADESPSWWWLWMLLGAGGAAAICWKFLKK